MDPPPPSPFAAPLDFCPECGSVLPHIGPTPKAPPCLHCGFTPRRDGLEGRTLRTVLELNPLQALMGRGAAAAPQVAGPLVERRCSRCGFGAMQYRVGQTRGADEGQTVFYHCPQCRFQEKEDS
ncbi:DNA-directed RNA polymerase I subunit RPA12 [Coturnix japonica]|uniref:DNA-directed RNA polymerase I subunit RPA12 n=1 Tax=Coturnix japonica TaxID=93934 RepID=UPI0007773414|nr:DNA-directed RNA polymerase I subunit RPA12 [Coturnix japonica]